MIKLRCLRAALLCGAVAFITLDSEPAKADPITSSIAAWTAVMTTTTAASAVAVYTAVNIGLQLALAVGLQYVTSSLSGGGGGQQKNATGLRTSIEFGDIRPRSIGIGKFSTGGSLVYANTFTYPGSNKANEYLVMVIALSDAKMAGLDKIFVGDVAGTYSTGGSTDANIPGYSIAEFEEGGEKYLWAQFYDGSQSTADSKLVTRFASDPDYPYPSSMIGTGVAYVILTARYNPGKFPGWPRYKFEGRGTAFYDQRLDSTSGGSGSHRFNDQSTWALTHNPMVVANNILRGFSAPTSGSPAWLYGLQTMNASRVPTASWFAAMNECDSTINGIGGSPEAKYRCGFELSVDQEPADILDDLMKSCNARMCESGGIYKPMVGAVGASVLSFTDDDIIITAAQTFEQFPSLADTVNGIRAKYAEPAESWNMKDAPPLYNSTYETEDGGRRLLADLSYDLVPYAGQVQRLMDSALLEARKFRKHTITLPPSAFKLEPNDTVTWTSVRNGYSSKLFRVLAVTVQESLDVTVVIAECDPADYDFDPGSDYRAVTTQIIYSPGSTALNAPTGLSVSASFKSLVLTWTNTENFDVEATEIWRSASSSFGGASKAADVAPDATSWIDDGLGTGTSYWYWIRYRKIDRSVSSYQPSSGGAGATASTVTAGTTDIADGSITTVKLGDAQVTTQKIGDGQVSTAKIGDSQVTTQKIGDSQITTVKIGDLQVTTDKLGNGSVSTGKLGIGPGTNMLWGAVPGTNPNRYNYVQYNPDAITYASGTYGVFLSTTSAPFGGGGAADDWTLPDFSTWHILQNNADGDPTGTTYFGCCRVTKLDGTTDPYYPVEEGKSYEFSAYTGAHRCKVDLIIEWRNSSGTYLSETVSSDYNDASASGGATLAGYKRLVARGVAPSGATQVTLSHRKYHTKNGETNSYMFITRSMFCEIGANVYQAVPWTAPPYGLFHAENIFSNSITAAKIAANTITASQIAANTITAAQIASSTITASQIAASTITATELATGAITAGKIAASAIDTSSLMVDGVVVTAKIGSGAATTHVSSSGTGPTTLSSTSVWTDLCTATITTNGSPVEVWGVCGFYNNTGSTRYANYRIVRDGSLVWPPSGYEYVRLEDGDYTFCPALIIQTPSQGTYTYKLQAKGYDSTGLEAFGYGLATDEIRR